MAAHAELGGWSPTLLRQSEGLSGPTTSLTRILLLSARRERFRSSPTSGRVDPVRVNQVQFKTAAVPPADLQVAKKARRANVAATGTLRRALLLAVGVQFPTAALFEADRRSPNHSPGCA